MYKRENEAKVKQVLFDKNLVAEIKCKMSTASLQEPLNDNYSFVHGKSHKDRFSSSQPVGSGFDILGCLFEVEADIVGRIMRFCNTATIYSLRLVCRSWWEFARFWFLEREAQSKILHELEMGVRGNGTLRKLTLSKVDGIYVAVGRMEAWTYSDHQLVVLPHTHRYSKLYAEHIHNISHRGVRADTAKIRSKYWIVGLGKLVRSIRYHCVTCRKREGKLQEQIMAPLPIERLKPAPMW